MSTGDRISLLCDDCGVVSYSLFNCYCRRVVCPQCRKRHDKERHRTWMERLNA